MLLVDYHGASAGARDFVAPIADCVSEFLQFLAAWIVDHRFAKQIVDHEGAFFGRFMTTMPVLSRVEGTQEPWPVARPNVRGNPYAPTIEAKHYQTYEKAGFLKLLPLVAEGARRGQSTLAMPVSAIQLFSYGDCAVSKRQAMVSYVGACDALFGKTEQSQLYTCAGMAACSGEPFEAAYREATTLYNARSEAAHDGITPTATTSARAFAMLCIRHLSERQEQLYNKRCIRTWLTPFVERVRSRDGRQEHTP